MNGHGQKMQYVGKDGHGGLERIMRRNRGASRGARSRMNTHKQLEGGKTNNGAKKRGNDQA